MVVVAPILVPLLGLLLCLLLWALTQAGETFFRALFGAIHKWVPSIPVVSGLIEAGTNKLIKAVVEPISRAAIAMEAPIVGFVVHVAHQIEGFAFAGYYTAVRTYDALWALRHVVIPALLRPLAIAIHALPRVIRIPAHEAHRAQVAAQKALSHAVAVTIPRALPWVDRRAGQAEAKAEQALRGLKGIRNLLAAGVIGALAIKALTRAGVGNIRCGNLKRFNRRVCGMDPSLLDSLLLDSLLILGTISLVEYAKFLESITDEATGIIHGFIREA